MARYANRAAQQPPPRILTEPTGASDVVFGVLVQLARKLLFIKPATKATFYLAFITGLSIISLYIEPSENYFIQKHNFLNVYGTKLGWFWTLLVCTPFIGLTSYLHHNSFKMTLLHLLRLVVATGFWYTCVNSFAVFEKLTGKCMGATAGHRNECFANGGKWIPGFDISGHTFILLYSILLMSEEAMSFRNWPISPKGSPKKEVNKVEHGDHQKRTRTVQWLFLGIFFVHIIWDFQLIVTSLYYHTVSHKLIGALFAVASWYSTYVLWYPRYFPSVPIQRHTKSF